MIICCLNKGGGVQCHVGGHHMRPGSNITAIQLKQFMKISNSCNEAMQAALLIWLI